MKRSLIMDSARLIRALPLALLLWLSNETLAQATAGGDSAAGNSSLQTYQQMCSSNGGYFQYGTIITPQKGDYPAVTNFKNGGKLQGIPLTHTHIEITSGVDGKIYDIAIDNVFAPDYDPHKAIVPPSYAKSLTANSTIYLCSGNATKVPYALTEAVATQGFDWVHTNCAASGYHSSFQNGFLYSQNVNLTNSQTYCRLWPN